MGVSLYTPIASIVPNKRRVGALRSLGIISVADALSYYPFRVTDPVAVTPLSLTKPGDSVAFGATVVQTHVAPMHARRGFRLDAVVDDSLFAKSRGASGAQAQLVFFSRRRSYVDWISSQLVSGAQIVVSGQASTFDGRLQFTHPDLVPVPPSPAMALEGGAAVAPEGAATAPEGPAAVDPMSAALAKVSRPRPVYHANARISSEHIHDVILSVLAALTEPIEDIIPEDVCVDRGLLHRQEAFRAVHDPTTTEDFALGIATLRYEEAFVTQTAVLRDRMSAQTSSATACEETAMRDTLIASLPFSLTDGQSKVVQSISRDMAANRPMQRLLEGEVGSGKTVVAVCAMLLAVGSGHQAVVVAPTRVLADQHHRTIVHMLEHAGLDVPVVFLTGGMRLAERRRALATAASGGPMIIIATHAAFSKTFQAPDLALVVIDEQHRFGVAQRGSLRWDSDDGATPHLLVMTATPIPRSAAMTWFGNLDSSHLTELPRGRKPIRTAVVQESDAQTMARMFVHIRTRIDAGERAYIVCPRIDADDSVDTDGRERSRGNSDDVMADDLIGPDDSDDGQVAESRPPLHAVDEIVQRLSHLPQFSSIRFATLTGRDDEDTKQRVMAGFADGTTPILVSTTVIEVGVDVAEASCIVIFDADRFGLSQLHQLRGRVGRGGTDAWAFLISRAEPDSLAARRLEVIEHSLDGARIAQADLELRGAGDVLGNAQSGGRSGLKLLRVVQDADLIVDARSRAEQILTADPDLAQHRQLAGAVLDLTRGNEEFITSG